LMSVDKTASSSSKNRSRNMFRSRHDYHKADRTRNTDSVTTGLLVSTPTGSGHSRCMGFGSLNISSLVTWMIQDYPPKTFRHKKLYTMLSSGPSPFPAAKRSAILSLSASRACTPHHSTPHHGIPQCLLGMKGCIACLPTSTLHYTLRAEADTETPAGPVCNCMLLWIPTCYKSQR
jgi:hypothetical protein